MGAASVNEGRIEDADVIITRISAPKRLARHISLDQAIMKNIVKPEWLLECERTSSFISPDDYAAIPSLLSEIPVASTSRDTPSRISNGLAPPIQVTPPNRSPTPSAPTPSSQAAPTDPRISWKAPYATHRISPLACPNQEIVAQLAIIMRRRHLDREQTGELAYARAIAGIKAYPKKITSAEEVAKIPYCSESIQTKVEEFLEDGVMALAEETQLSSKYQILALFVGVYGIGPKKANELYNEGHRSLDDLRRRFKGSDEAASGHSPSSTAVKGASKGKRVKTDREREPWTIEAALSVHDELQLKIPRAEVEEIAHEVSLRLARIGRGFEYTICGGYRRGKEFSNDVDILISRPGSDEKDMAHCCQTLVGQLQDSGLITHLIHLSTYTSDNGAFYAAKRVLGGKNETWGFDSLDKALTVYKMTDRPDRVHRRVDFIFAPWSVYWTAVVGWTGSTQFERDIRRWSKDHCGIKFDSTGMVRIANAQPIYARSEREVFEVLDLPWIDPTMRNADYAPV
ncbi:Nucleotidyltransferase [Clavulina sp. PMI_390]|nr:Nucleotidyltransferase [Clavulina sp. PMI_390]